MTLESRIIAKDILKEARKTSFVCMNTEFVPAVRDLLRPISLYHYTVFSNKCKEGEYVYIMEGNSLRCLGKIESIIEALESQGD